MCKSLSTHPQRTGEKESRGWGSFWDQRVSSLPDPIAMFIGCHSNPYLTCLLCLEVAVHAIHYSQRAINRDMLFPLRVYVIPHKHKAHCCHLVVIYAQGETCNLHLGVCVLCLPVSKSLNHKILLLYFSLNIIISFFLPVKACC